jgi:ADP-ribose pyrophosphatase
MEDWITLRRRELVDARPWLRLWAEDVRLPDGRVIDDFQRVEMPDYVVIVALTTEGTVVVERSYKHGPRRVCLSLPAGYVEADEDVLLAAQRELREETGHAGDTWTHLGSFTVDGNRGCGAAHLFLARETRLVALPNAGDLEEMEIITMAPQDALMALRRGDFPLLPMATALSLASINGALS